MPGADESTFGLAAWLRSRTDEELADLIAVREVRESSVKDWFDLAEALLGADSIARALARLDRPALLALASRDAEGLEPARRLALAYDTATIPAAVADALPTLDDSPQPPALVPVTHVDRQFTDRLAAEHAYRTTTAVVELLDLLQREPARALARGGISLPDAKRLATVMAVELDEVPAIVGIAERADLLAQEQGRLLPRDDAPPRWTTGSWADRWALLAGAWLDRLPDDIRVLLADRTGAEWGERLGEAVDWLYPLGGEWMRERVAVYTRDAALLGITAGHVPSTAGGILLRLGPDEAAPAMGEGFPPTVDTVYVQHDLSIVAPGALRPDLDAALRELAERDGSSSYRVTAASLTRAFALGRDEAHLRSFLDTVSLTGIPQPLDYLLRETAARYGTVRVRARGVGSEVRSADELQLRAILADSVLANLGLVREGDTLRSGFDRDLVFWALAEARYPVAAEDASGRIEPIRAHRTTVPARPAAPPTLLERLRASSAEDDELAWITRQLDVAIRGKAALAVTVALPGGDRVEYQLEPASVAGGRLRARDRGSDIERTLPLRSITAIRPAGATAD